MNPIPDHGLYSLRIFHRDGMWLFNDPERDLIGEPFVDGMDDILDATSGCVPRTLESRACAWFRFANFEDPACRSVLVRDEPLHGGYYYRLEGTDLRGWLCPNTLKYFPVFPERIRFRCEALEGADDRRR